MFISAIIDFGALLSLIAVFKILRFVYLVIGNDLNSPLLFFGANFLNMLNGMNHFRSTFQCSLVLLTMQRSGFSCLVIGNKK